MHRPAVVIVEIALVRMRRHFEDVGRLPQVEESAAILRRHRTARFGRALAEMPLTDMVCSVARLPQGGGERGRTGIDGDAVLPDTMPARILAGEDAAACGRADGLATDSGTEDGATPCHLIQIWREIHRVQASGSDAVPAELV